MSSIAFLLASTNLVIELGIIISIFLGWQFVVGEYVGGILLILSSWLLIKVINPHKLIQNARKNLGSGSDSDETIVPFSKKIKSIEGWAKVGKQYAMVWKMVWKDVTVGFTIAGIISAFVPDTFFQTLFINSGNGVESFSFPTLLQHAIIGPIAAFVTFIGSMGNIPLAALLFEKGVSFAGVIAFIFSDLVVFPVLRINARYYGWKMSFFILFLLFSSLIVTSLLLHFAFDIFGILPNVSSISITGKEHFQIDYTFWMNIAFLIVSGVLIYFGFIKGRKVHHHKEMAPKSPLMESILKWIAFGCYGWLSIGIIIQFFA